MSDGKRLAWWDGKLWVLAFDVVFAAGIVAFPFLDDQKPPLTAPTLLACVVIFAGLLVRRRFPLAAVAITPLSMLFFPTIEVTVVAYTVASRRGLKPLTAVSAVVGAVVLAVWPARGDGFGWQALTATFVLFVGVPTLLGLWVFQRRKLLEALRGRAEQAERERDLRSEQAVAAERRRIAREMHDVVAHRVSAIALQSGALTMTAPDEHTERVAEVIRKTSTDALAELREILQVLRDERPGEPNHSVPSLNAVPELVADAAGTGLAVTLALPDPVPEVTPSVGRAAYRVVQESLTNAAKHAPGAAVRVNVTVTGEHLVMEITNRRGRETTTLPGSGYGLIGMLERVSLAGGTLKTGWADGVFRVHAMLPSSPGEERS
ncbi:sensor histidine kinase [Amycolatopsis sp.]|jgi:signal transduction histidine kinase|uniref:sensor histidine kinase n=1 Tax=Amycolatopsis sp. TaxID=37632 RepID=UPI002DFC5D43|nr:histidine kinase [Amycolatopsis sp.]